jgi:hypothetical protein
MRTIGFQTRCHESCGSWRVKSQAKDPCWGPDSWCFAEELGEYNAGSGEDARCDSNETSTGSLVAALFGWLAG